MSVKTERITQAVAGEQVAIRLNSDGQVHKHSVLPPCDVTNNGAWYCVTHLKGFENQMQKDSHISDYGEHGPRAKHKLVWLCFAHGPEQP